MSLIKNPMHPGEFLHDAYMEPLELSITKLAEKLDVSQSTLSRLVNKKSDLSYEMAIKISYVLGRTAESWMNVQMLYSLSESQKKTTTEKLKKINIHSQNLSFI